MGNKTFCLVITEENSKITWSRLRSVLLTGHCRGVNSSTASQVCHVMVYYTNYLKKILTNNPFFSKKNMQSMTIIP